MSNRKTRAQQPQRRVSSSPKSAQQRSTSSFLVGLSDADNLAVRGYTRLIDSPDVAAGVGKLADIVSNATIHLMENTDKGDVRVKDALAKFIDITPYSLGTRKSFISWLVIYMLTQGDGNAVVLPVTQGGKLQDLRPMPGAMLIPRDNGDSYQVLWRGKYFEPDQVLHFVFRPDPIQPWRGTGIRIQLREVLRNLRQAAATTNGFMSDKWKPSIIVKVDAMADEFSGPEGRNKLLNEYIANTKAGEPWVIPADLMDVKAVRPLSLADLAISDSVELDKRAVAAAIGVPPFFVGVGEYNKDAYNNTVRTAGNSIVTVIQQELTKKILLSPTRYFQFNQRKLYAYDLKELAQVGDDQYVRGIMSGNEVRDWLDMSPVSGLDERVILENYIPAGMIGDQKKLNPKEGESK